MKGLGLLTGTQKKGEKKNKNKTPTSWASDINQKFSFPAYHAHYLRLPAEEMFAVLYIFPF